MELFSLLAKLTLDKKDFDRGMEEAQSTADNFTMPDDNELELSLDNSEYNDALDESEEKSESFSSNIGTIFQELKGVLVATGVAAIVAGIVTSLKEGINLAKTHGDTIDKQSKKMALSAKSYQEWSYALELSGASIDDLNRGMKSWQKTAGDEDAFSKLGGAFEALGIDAGHAQEAIERAARGQGNLDELLNQTLYRLADYSGGDKGWIMTTLFGNNATMLNALLENTSGELRDMKEEANDLGIIMSDQEVANAAAYTDATTRLEQSLNGIKEAFAADILPLLTDAANTVATIVAFFNPRTKRQSLSEMFADKDGKFAEEIADIEGTSEAALSLFDQLEKMGDTSKMTADQYEIWKGTAQALIDLVPSLGDVIDVESGQIKANSDEIKENIKQWENLAKQKALQAAKEERYAAIIEKNKEMIDKSVEANQHLAEVEGARKQTIEDFNKVLERYGFSTLGEDATLEDIRNMRTTAVSSYSGDDYSTMVSEINDSLAEIEKADTEAIKARQEAEKLNAELEEGKADYEAWLAAAEAMYGGLDSDAESATSQAQALKDVIDSIPGQKTIRLDVPQMMTHAIGSDYIPYDNYPALLHRGEKILTATEARRGVGGSMDLGNLEDRIERAIRAGMDGATVNAYMNGKRVTEEVNRQNINAVKGRRFNG